MSSTKPAENPTSFAPDLEIVGDKVRIQPTGFTAGAKVEDGGITERRLVQQMGRFRQNPFEFLREISLFVSGTGWRAYDDFVGQPIFYSGFTEKVKSEVLHHPLLQGKIAELAELRTKVEEKDGLLNGPSNNNGDKSLRRTNEIIANLREVVDTMIDNMICKMESKTFIRGAYYLCTQLLTRAYHQGIHVSSEEVLRLRAVAKEAAEKKKSIIFLPCHKSHVDYVSLQIICYRLGIALPVVVAGDNLNIPLLGPFLQHAGAMWIRRSFGNDPLYHTLVQAYVDTLLSNGYNFECFVEGGRSRTGKLLPPKYGILSFLLDSVSSGRVDDAIICPVSTQYDKVIETESYISELLGQPKQKENLKDFLSSSSVLSLKLGRVDVRFHEPWSLKQFITEQLTRLNKNPSSISLVDPAERGRILRTLGYRVLSQINDVSVIMPTALVGTVLLTLRGRGVGKAELVRRVDWLCERVRAKGGRVAHFYRAATEHVVDRALEDLGPKLVGEVGGLAEPTFYAVDRFQLSFYRNMTIHLFITEALVSAAMYTRVKQGGGPANQRISYDELLSQVSFLSQIFRGEFIFPPEGLTTNLEKTLHGLERDNVIKVTRNSTNVPTVIELSDQERQCGRENYDFYCFLVWPFIEACWLGAVSLLGLTPPLSNPHTFWVDLKKAQDNAQLLGKTLYHQGDLSYFEAVNKETLKNAYQRFEEEGIIIVARSKESGTAATLRIAPNWMPERDPETGKLLPRGRLWDFTDLIAQSRREGKNRRDGATVSSRVLTMSDAVGQVLFRKAELPSSGTPEDDVKLSTTKMRRKAIETPSKL
ncbi:glycerol-3-phosphate acyltransferase, putative [Coccidioides posadasii C735 delta SOWgp]|uniref:Glycerol-3-phosphate acyltransferase, putative n=1 Tax=Coccidioides posadasii (strain C735) TaxID=222929 RepID=C5PI71_COCP7|nr:glycerol-3-phosphate acyltransferase, putative [Coccidioides posadasii C735 delta SOWgp]EER24224.1 glycerol-3-phosphate acyltransferase, putative [Coccidioides posadasii C735 delta SOWgp]|eukprot:XP_003066369.1 glycerol-3-phosphate acyltransferase, putative [Coccidioides posadasii C735 delta SOWgp]